MNIVSLLYRSL